MSQIHKLIGWNENENEKKSVLHAQHALSTITCCPLQNNNVELSYLRF